MSKTTVEDFDPSNNRFLVELKRLWQAGKYQQDTEVECTIEEALESIVEPKCILCHAPHSSISCPSRLV